MNWRDTILGRIQRQPEKGSILLIEDEPLYQDDFRNSLRKKGYVVTLAEDHLKAIELLKSQTFDAILCDGETGCLDDDGHEVMDGRTFLTDKQNNGIPVIAISQKNSLNLLMVDNGAVASANKLTISFRALDRLLQKAIAEARENQI